VGETQTRRMLGGLNGRRCNLYRRNGPNFTVVGGVEGRRSFRLTGTDDPTTARRILKEWQNQRVLEEHGIETRAMVLERNRLSVTDVFKGIREWRATLIARCG